MAVRNSFPAAEAKYPWLKIVLDTYYISDVQVEEHLVSLARRGVAPACKRGCDACCKGAMVPFTEPEFTAISWYASEILSGQARVQVKQRLFDNQNSLECPFLIDGACSIYPVRPLICRQFLVKGSPCSQEEDVSKSRPDDILKLPRDTVIRPVAMRLLDYWNIGSRAKKRQAFENGFIHQAAKSMHELDWNLVAKTMNQFDEA